MRKPITLILMTIFINISCNSHRENMEKMIPIEELTLKNGLHVILAPRQYTKFTTILMSYNVGGVFETKENLGLSHLLEHLMFKSTKNLKNGEFNNILEKELGGSFNATTSYDATNYYEIIPKAGTEKVLQLEAERMQYLTLEKNEVDKEKLVVLEEMRNRIENSDVGYFITKANEFFYKDFPYGRDLGGTDNIMSISLETIHQYYKTYYAPNNATLIISGAIDNVDTLISWIQKYFSHITAQAIDFKQLPRDFTPPTTSFNIERETPTNYVLLMTKIHSGKDPSMKVLNLLGDLLTGNNSSYLQEELVVKKKLVSNIVSGPDIMKLKSSFSIFFTPYNKKDIPLIKSIIMETLQKIEKDPTLAKRIQSQLLLNKTEFFNSIEKQENIAFHLSSGISIARDPYLMMNILTHSVSKKILLKQINELKKQTFTEITMLKK